MFNTSWFVIVKKKENLYFNNVKIDMHSNNVKIDM